ncbi:hypothetical protein G6F68_019877 [Rhizopus microsporus]|nr:hypothetical protein G6F68_019877 [Rhizopus microsporus]
MDDDGYYTTDTSTTISSLTEDELNQMDSKQVLEYEHQRRKYEAKLRRLSRPGSLETPEEGRDGPSDPSE